jgi:hypothetical protein
MPDGTQASTTVIWLRVSVPVLSVQMKVVEPSVSTASRCRTSTWRLAICSAPHASDRVTVGSSASGTSATVTPMANTNPSLAGLPSSRASVKNTPPTPTAMAAMARTTRCSSWASGVVGLAVTVTDQTSRSLRRRQTARTGLEHRHDRIVGPPTNRSVETEVPIRRIRPPARPLRCVHEPGSRPGRRTHPGRPATSTSTCSSSSSTPPGSRTRWRTPRRSRSSRRPTAPSVQTRTRPRNGSSASSTR